MTLTPDEKTLDPPEGFTVLQEGKARILQRENDVFYNKAQVVNRDLSLSVMRQFQKVRAAEHAETKRAPKNRRLKGLMCVTPKDSKVLPHLMNPDEIEDMYRTKHDEPDGGDGDGDKKDEDEAPRTKPPLKPIRILEGMAASGLRAIRYARELDDVDRDRPAPFAAERVLEANPRPEAADAADEDVGPAVVRRHVRPVALACLSAVGAFAEDDHAV